MILRVALLLVLLAATIAAAGDKTTAPEQVPRERQEEIADKLLMEGIQLEAAMSAVETMMRAGFTADQMVHVVDMLHTGNGQIPVAEPVLAKIHEGAAKGAGPATILAAVERVRNRYLLSSRLSTELGLPGDRHLIAYLADCLAAGLSEHDAEEISAALRTRNLAMNTGDARTLTLQTVLTARTMVRQGVSAVTTREVLMDALTHGYDGQRMLELRQALDRSGNGNLENTARRFGAAMRSGAQINDPQDSQDSSQGTSANSGDKGGHNDTGKTGNGNDSSSESGNGSGRGDSGNESGSGNGSRF